MQYAAGVGLGSCEKINSQEKAEKTDSGWLYHKLVFIPLNRAKESVNIAECVDIGMKFGGLRDR